jgi:hypothetical protein
MTVLAWATVSRNGVTGIGFLPCRLTPDGLVHPLSTESDEGCEVVKYMSRCIESQALNGRLSVENAPRFADLATLRVVAA